MSLGTSDPDYFASRFMNRVQTDYEIDLSSVSVAIIGRLGFVHDPDAKGADGQPRPVIYMILLGKADSVQKQTQTQPSYKEFLRARADRCALARARKRAVVAGAR